MTSHIPRIAELSLEVLAKWADELPDDLRAVSDDVLAQLIIISALGPKFWKREFTSAGDPNSGFFRRYRDVRALHAAHLIWRLKNTPGFEVLLRKNAEKDFESTYFELAAAEMISSASNSIVFVEPSGVKGRDFDLRAHGLWGIESANIEFKCRRNPFLNRNAIRNYLNGIRDQLPSGGNGVVLCKIPNAAHVLGQNEVTISIASWLRNSTNRVRYVVLCWDTYEGNELAIGISYSIVDANGVGNLTFGENPAHPVTEISFLHDLGIYRSIDPELVTGLLFHAGVTPKFTKKLGQWSSALGSWWDNCA